MPRLNSTLWRIVALHGVAIAVASFLLPAILSNQLRATAETFEQRLLKDRLALISHTLVRDPSGAVSLPRDVAETVRGDGSFAFRVTDIEGRSLLASQSAPPTAPGEAGRTETYFEVHSKEGSFIGVQAPAIVGGETLRVEVAQNLDFPDVVLDDVETQFLSHIAWQIAVVLLGLFALDLVVVAAAVGPIQRASVDAQAIDTSRLDVRLDEAGLPSETRPLVHAINNALDRLERGFRLQHDFTADVAHELRTPLSVMRLRVDALADRGAATALVSDLEMMSRVVDQLLALAELEAMPPGEPTSADLFVVAERVVRHLAPAAIARRRRLALVGSQDPNWIRTSPGAVFLTLRNLVENALEHTPEGGVVEVRVEPDGVVHVTDQGEGVPASDREVVFERFWRRDRGREGAGGLGLAIVARIAAAQGASVSVGEAPGGGADFVLRFPALNGRSSR